MGAASSTEERQAVEETAESAYQRKAAAAYDKYGARDERGQPTLSPCLPRCRHRLSYRGLTTNHARH